VNPFTTPSKIIITCNSRLSPFLLEELTAMGIVPEQIFSSGVELRGTMTDCIRLNLMLRCASQVLYSLKSFPANRPEDVYQQVVAYPWQNLIASNGYLSVTSTVYHFTVNNNLFVNVKVKDAIADRIRREMGERPDSGPGLDHTVIHLYWKEEQAEIFIDTAGHSLSRHGYRKIPGEAPMLEGLASAVVMATRWDGTTPFVNPMCGSSTIAIEAILIATNRYPGLVHTNYSFMHVLGYEKESYAAEMEKLKGMVKEIPGLTVLATDNREDAIHISRINAAAAGVDHLLKLEVCDFTETEIPPAPGVICFNPPYGERMGDTAALENTYSQLGDFMKTKCQGYMGYIFTGNLDLAKKIGLKAKRRIEFYNAKLDCRLLEYELYQGTRREPKTDVIDTPAE